MKKKKAVAAMSGGVDSSVAAALLKEQGYDVIGITMDLFSLPPEFCRAEDIKSCCGWGAAEDANRVASTLGIPHYVINLRTPFEKYVIDDFCREYVRGRTPNPCIRCNQYIKFDVLMEKAKKFQADYLATGHHARVAVSRSGKYLLKKGKDKVKDQSYFLYFLSQEKLSRILFPVGEFTKEEVRKKAKEWGLPVALHPESQEVCFVPDGSYPRFLKDKFPGAFHPGPIVDKRNRVLGEHKGILHFTVGQRRGLGIAAPSPLYVLEIHPHSNTIVVGNNEDLYKKGVIISDVQWITQNGNSLPFRIKAKIRYKHHEAEAVIAVVNRDEARVEFDKPQRAITPGQSVVFYRGDTVLGGGIIKKSL